MNDITCKNCNKHFNGKYCPKCGQAASEARFTLKTLAKELQSEFLPVKKGLFYTIKELIVRPLSTIKNYLEGKRVAYLAPLKLLLTSVAVYLFLFVQLDVKQYKNKFNTLDDTSKKMEVITAWMQDHLSYSTLLGLLPMAFFLWLFFKKMPYTFAEHIVICFFITTIGLFIDIALLLIGYVFHWLPWIVTNSPAFYLQLIVGLFIYIGLMSPMAIGKTVLKYTLANICCFAFILVITTTIFLIIYK